FLMGKQKRCCKRLLLPEALVGHGQKRNCFFRQLIVSNALPSTRKGWRRGWLRLQRLMLLLGTMKEFVKLLTYSLQSKPGCIHPSVSYCRRLKVVGLVIGWH